MPGWERILTEEQIWNLVSYVKSLSPRFGSETVDPIGTPPQTPASVERGKEVYKAARCFMCHGEAGRGDGGIAVTLNFQWGIPYAARDLTRGWTFKGGNEPQDVYLRITGGLNGTPMGLYKDLLTDEERWDLAHYVASLDREPSETSEDFVVVATHVNGDLPDFPDAAMWAAARPAVVPLAGQVILDPPLRWWTPTVGTVTVRAIWNGTEIAFLLEWNDPTGPEDSFADSAQIQFAVLEASKPYLLFGDQKNPVRIWQWQTGDELEEWTASGLDNVETHFASFRAGSGWSQGRWQVVFRRALQGEPDFEPGEFIATLFSIRDGANGELGDVRAISTWLYTTVEPPRSIRSWLLALVYVLGTILGELWVLSRLGP